IRDGHVTGVQTCALPILRALEHRGVRLALLTGNAERVARLRMGRLGLARFFPQGQGAFGCESDDRGELLRRALERARVRPGDAAARKSVGKGKGVGTVKA